MSVKPCILDGNTTIIGVLNKYLLFLEENVNILTFFSVSPLTPNSPFRPCPRAIVKVCFNLSLPSMVTPPTLLLLSAFASAPKSSLFLQLVHIGALCSTSSLCLQHRAFLTPSTYQREVGEVPPPLMSRFL